MKDTLNPFSVKDEMLLVRRSAHCSSKRQSGKIIVSLILSQVVVELACLDHKQ